MDDLSKALAHVAEHGFGDSVDADSTIEDAAKGLVGDDDKGEMVFVYKSDLQEFLTWYAAKGVDETDMNPRQAEALEALWADSAA